RARTPPSSFACSVFTRPPRISGKPVKSPTSVTAMPAARSAFAVPPVERSSKPFFTSPRPSSTTPLLSVTLRTASRLPFGIVLPPAEPAVPPLAGHGDVRGVGPLPLRLARAQVGLEERLDVALHDGVDVADLEAGALVLHELVGGEGVGPDLVAEADVGLLARERADFRVAF